MEKKRKILKKIQTRAKSTRQMESEGMRKRDKGKQDEENQ